MKLLVKLMVASSLAVILGIGSALAVVWVMAGSSAASPASLNPYERAASILAPLHPGGPTP